MAGDQSSEEDESRRGTTSSSTPTRQSEPEGITAIMSLMQQQMQQQAQMFQQQALQHTQMLQEEREYRRKREEKEDLEKQENRAYQQQLQAKLERQALEVQEMAAAREEKQTQELEEKAQQQQGQEHKLAEERKSEDAIEKERQFNIKMKELEVRIAQATAKSESERIEELRQARELDQKDKAARAIQASLDKSAKAVPKPPLMVEGEDILDYLEMYEMTQKKRLIAEKHWAAHLIPLLEPSRRAVASHLSAEDKEDYKTLKAAILKTASYSAQQNAKKWWELTRDSSLEHSVWASQVKRATKRLWSDGNPQTLENAVNLEKLLRTYPPELRQKVRDFNPTTVDEAVDLLNRFDPQSDVKKSTLKGDHSLKPHSGPWKPKWRESWKKPSTPTSSKPGVEEGKADQGQGRPPQVADYAEPSKEQGKEKESGSKFPHNRQHLKGHPSKGKHDCYAQA